MKRILIIGLFFAILFVENSHAQYANTKIKDKNQAYTDSLKQVKYDNVFPIWGQKAYEKGFDIFQFYHEPHFFFLIMTVLIIHHYYMNIWNSARHYSFLKRNILS